MIPSDSEYYENSSKTRNTPLKVHVSRQYVKLQNKKPSLLNVKEIVDQHDYSPELP